MGRGAQVTLLLSYFLLFLMGVVYDICAALWVHYLERSALLPAMSIAWVLGALSMIGVRESVFSWAHMAAYIFGYGCGTGLVIVWKRRAACSIRPRVAECTEYDPTRPVH
jgi:hypothetical protein